MIYIVMGFSKSGTTLTARTLDAAGINFRPEKKRDKYPQCPYENLEGCKICMEQIGAKKKQSLFMPNLPCGIHDSNKILPYIKMRSKLDQDWGFKFPYMTFVYEFWRRKLPSDHMAIGVKRTASGVLSHYNRKGRIKLTKDKKNRILGIWELYNHMIDSYNIPVIQFEEFIKYGPVVLEKIVGFKLPDVRDGKKH